MPAFTADATTLSELFAAADDAAKRAVLDTALGDGTLTVLLTNGAQQITGTFSGSLYGTAIVAVDSATLSSVAGVDSTPDDNWSLRVTGAGGRYVEFPGGAFSYVGPGGTGTIDVDDVLKLTIRFGDIPSGGGGGGGGEQTLSFGVLGGYVEGDSNYVPSTPPAGYNRVLMAPTDQPFQLTEWSNGWHRYNSLTNPGFSLPHERLHDTRTAANQDVAFFLQRIFTARHTYNTAQIAELANSNGGCPKILQVYMWGKWMAAASHISEVQSRFGPENQFGQIQGVTRYPSMPYGGGPVADVAYLKEFVQAIYRPVGVAGPGGEPGLGYTASDFPIIELGNEPKWRARVVDDPGRHWDDPNFNPAGAFNLLTYQEFNSYMREMKSVAPAGVLMAAGGNEGDFRSSGRTLANPTGTLSWFQCMALSSDGAGGRGIDHIDIVFFHPYMYNGTDDAVQTEIDNGRAQLEYIADFLGRPEIANIPIHANEIGHVGYSAANIIADQGATQGYQTIARNMKRSAIRCAANASRQQCVGITHYQDRPYSGPNGETDALRTYGAPSENAVLIAAAQYCNQIPGKVIRQAYAYPDGSVWAEFDGNLILQA